MKSSRLIPALVLTGLLPLPALLHAQTATTAVPGLISYQGRVLDGSGNPVGAGTPVNRTVTFRIWGHQSSTGTNELKYSEQQTVTISDGEFSVPVGQGVAVTSTAQFGYNEVPKKLTDLGTAFTGATRFLGVTVDDGTAAPDNEITPRQQIVTSGYSFRAKFAESLGTSGSGTSLNTLDNGNVGIGNANPPSRLTISGSNTGTSTPQLLVTDGADPNERLRIGVDNSGNGTGFIQSFKEGVGAQNLLLNPNGGFVGIGKAPATALDVNGTVTATQFSGSGAGLTSIPAASLVGVVPDASLSGNLAYLNNNSSFTGQKYFMANVGIGVTNPGYPLSFADGTGDKISLWGQGANHFGFGIANALLQIHSNTAASDIAFGHGSSNSFTELMRIKGTGNVGIGTNTPSAPLSFSYALGEKISLYQGGTETYGIAVQGSELRLHTDLNSSDVTFGYGNGVNWVERMRIKGSGNVGIGTTVPTQARLAVVGGVSRSGLTGAYINGAVTGHAVTHAGHTISLYASDSVWVGNTVIATSDARVKNIEGRSDGQDDLRKLMGIEITNYRYKDGISKGNIPQKKVIAQQVEKVFPQAVSRHTDVVPDIYKSGIVKKGWVYLETGLKKGERVRLIGEKEEGIHEVLEVADGKFRTGFAAEDGEKVFVFGREVDDFRAVDYEAISMLNVSAAQQIKREKDSEIKTLREENAALQKEIAALKTEIKERDSKDKAQDAKLAAIEKALSGQASAKVAVRTASVRSRE